MLSLVGLCSWQLAKRTLGGLLAAVNNQRHRCISVHGFDCPQALAGVALLAKEVLSVKREHVIGHLDVPLAHFFASVGLVGKQKNKEESSGKGKPDTRLMLHVDVIGVRLSWNSCRPRSVLASHVAGIRREFWCCEGFVLTTAVSWVEFQSVDETLSHCGRRKELQTS